MLKLDLYIFAFYSYDLYFPIFFVADEFIYRTGYGNAIAYLQTRGLI